MGEVVSVKNSGKGEDGVRVLCVLNHGAKEDSYGWGSVIVSSIKRRIFLLIILETLFVLMGIGWAYTRQDIYRAETVLIPTGNEFGGSNLRRLSGGIGSVAGLVGVDLDGSGVDNLTIAIELARSKPFVVSLVKNNGWELPMLAAREWISTNNQWRIDERRFRVSESGELLLVDGGRPSDSDIYEAYLKSVSISHNAKSGLVSISAKSHSPLFSVEVIERIVDQVNKHVRRMDVEEAKKSLDYLKQLAGEAMWLNFVRYFMD
ncbi:MAG: hypothetical protein R3F47_16240 [Gammaproteobacteria bacterium]